MYRKVYFIGIAAYVFLLILSLVFYKERCVFLDASYFIFQLARTGSFCVELYRFGDAFGQVLPVAGYKAGLSLAGITACYSAGFILYYLACYLVCGAVLKQYRFALVILLINLLFAADTFYWPISQVPQGMALLMVILSLLWGRTLQTIGIMRCAIAAVAMVILAFFHPLMIFAVGYTAAFFLLRKESGVDRKLLYGLVGALVALLAIKSLFFRTDYEHHSLSGLKNFVRLYPDYIRLYSHSTFLQNCLRKYYWIPVFFIAIVALYSRRRAYLQLCFFVVCVIGYLLLVNIMYPSAETPLFYIENLYLPLGLFIGLPLVFELLPVLDRRKAGLAIISLVIVSGCIRVYAAHSLYTERLNWERAFLMKNGDRKIIADAKKNNAALLQMIWGTPYEFWHLSTIEQGRSASVIIDNDPPHRDWAKYQTKAFVVNWNVYPYSMLDSKFFRFTDTTSGYIIEKPETISPRP